MRSYVVAILIACCFPRSATTSDLNLLNTHQWGSVTLFHGLPSDHVRAIAQDTDRVLWFGTDGGLAKYDGRRIQKVVDAGLPAGRVRVLTSVGDGILWVATDSGAARLIHGSFRPIAETAGQAITAIAAREHGKVLLVSEQGTIFTCVSNADGSVQVRSIGPNNSPLLNLSAASPLPLTSLAIADGSLVIGTRGRGLLTLSGDVVKEVLSQPRPFFVGSTAVDRSGNLWFCTDTTSNDSGLYQSGDLLRPQKSGANTGSVSALDFDSKGDLWVATAGHGAYRYRDSHEVAHYTFENTAGGLRSNDIYSVFVDREGVVWFGTDRGVCRYDPGGPQTETLSTRPDSNFVRAIFRSANSRWWSGTNRGLFVREPGQAIWRPVEAMSGRTIHAIGEDSTGRVLIGAAGGLFRESTNRGEFERIERVSGTSASADSVRAIVQFQGATYLATFGSGLERFDGHERALVWPLESTDPLQREVVSLHSDGKNKLWIGTAAAGLFMFDGVQTTQDDALSALKGSPVWDVELSSDGAVWLATGRGLYVLRSNKLEAVLASSDSRRIIVERQPGVVWCATAGNGLAKLVLDEHGVVLSRFNTEHGLPSDSVFTLLSSGSDSAGAAGELWLGTNRGITKYTPSTVAPILRATRILGRRPFPIEQLSGGLNLEYPQNSLLVEVEAISSRTFPEQFQYDFVLANDTGKSIRQRTSVDSQFVVENLRPGRYRIAVRAFSNDLVPSMPLSFDFTVARAPFPWTSAALSILLVLALIALSYGYRQNRKLTQTNAALADTRRQLANETENERRRIARDLHDQTLSDLRRLALLTDRMPAHGEPDSAVFRDEIESISTEIRHICEDLSPSVLANVGLAAALEWALADAVAHMPPDHRLDVEFQGGADLDDRPGFDEAVQIQIYRIVQEVISNVCRHAEATRVRLAVEVLDGQFVVALEDNGRGFDWTNSRVMAGRGLNNIRSRASLIDAVVDWSSRPQGGGSVFTLRKRVM
jgi:signal transduction histidine kinase/ligand-binding sensor domain-containing protein